MCKKVKDCASFDGPFDRPPDRRQEPVELPAAVAKGADVADRAHWHFDQSIRIAERLCFFVRRDNRLEHLIGRLLHRLRIRMGGILAADPGEAEIEEPFANIGSIGESVGEAAWSSEARGINANPRL